MSLILELHQRVCSVLSRTFSMVTKTILLDCQISVNLRSCLPATWSANLMLATLIPSSTTPLMVAGRLLTKPQPLMLAMLTAMSSNCGMAARLLLMKVKLTMEGRRNGYTYAAKAVDFFGMGCC